MQYRQELQDGKWVYVVYTPLQLDRRWSCHLCQNPENAKTENCSVCKTERRLWVECLSCGYWRPSWQAQCGKSFCLYKPYTMPNIFCYRHIMGSKDSFEEYQIINDELAQQKACHNLRLLKEKDRKQQQIQDLENKRKKEERDEKEYQQQLEKQSKEMPLLENDRKALGEEKDLCLICVDAPKVCAAVSCGHKFCCANCAVLFEKEKRPCALCRGPIEKFIRIFD